MANQDLMRMLTGVSSGQQPVMQQPVAGSPNFRGDFGAQQNRRVSEGLGRAVRGGEPSDQERLAAAEAKLDLNSIEGLTTVAKIQQIRGDMAGAAKTAAKIQAMQAAGPAAAEELRRYNQEFKLKERDTAAREVPSASGGNTALVKEFKVFIFYVFSSPKDLPILCAMLSILTLIRIQLTKRNASPKAFFEIKILKELKENKRA